MAKMIEFDIVEIKIFDELAKRCVDVIKRELKGTRADPLLHAKLFSKKYKEFKDKIAIDKTAKIDETYFNLFLEQLNLYKKRVKTTKPFDDFINRLNKIKKEFEEKEKPPKKEEKPPKKEEKKEEEKKEEEKPTDEKPKVNYLPYILAGVGVFGFALIFFLTKRR